MKIRVYCELCGKGILGEDYDHAIQQRIIEMMVFHSDTEYSRLAAHRKDRRPTPPRYLVEYPK